eukprot:1185196-Prorocentrum_minimum.AAC.1
MGQARVAVFWGKDVTFGRTQHEHEHISRPSPEDRKEAEEYLRHLIPFIPTSLPPCLLGAVGCPSCLALARQQPRSSGSTFAWGYQLRGLGLNPNGVTSPLSQW